MKIGYIFNSKKYLYIIWSFSDLRRKKVLVSEPEPCGSGVCDLLGQIMQDQTLLQMEGRNVTINRDGQSLQHVCLFQ